MAAGQKAVESTVKEGITLTTVKEEASAATDRAGHILKMEKEDHHSLAREDLSETAKEEASATTDHAGHSLKVEKDSHLSLAREDHSETVKEDHLSLAKEGLMETAKEEVSTAKDHADHSLRVVKEDHHSLVKGNHTVIEEAETDSGTPARRASTRRISIISVMRKRAESTR